MFGAGYGSERHSLYSKAGILTFIHCPAISDINSSWFRVLGSNVLEREDGVARNESLKRRVHGS
jgi:hypothetical protein